MKTSSIFSTPAVTLIAARPLNKESKQVELGPWPLLDVRNREVSAVPTASAARATPGPQLRLTHFSNVEPANGTAAAEGTGDTLQELRGQIQALVTALTKDGSPELRKKAERVQRHLQGPLDRAATASLSRLLKQLPPSKQMSPLQQRQRDALRTLTRAADAELQLKAEVARHAKRQVVNHAPGAVRETTVGASAGAAVGIAGFAEAGVTGSAYRTTTTATFDDLAIARFATATVGLDASVEAGLPTGLQVGAHAGGYLTLGTGEVADKMEDHVLELARDSVARRLGGPRLLRMGRRLLGQRRDRYAERVSKALAVQNRLPLLLGPTQPVPATAFHPAPPPLITATLRTLGGSAGAHAGIGMVDASLSVGRSKTEVDIALPVRLTDDSADAAALRQDKTVQHRLQSRLKPLLRRSAELGRSDTPRSQTLALAQQILREPGAADALRARLNAVTHLDKEFQHLEALAYHAQHAPARVHAPLTSLARAWGVDRVHYEPVLIAMLDTLAWLQATPSPTEHTEEKAVWEHLQQRVKEVADHIHDSRIPHDRQQVHQGTHAFKQMFQRLSTWQGNVGITVAPGMASVAARASVVHTEREDPDPLRAGTYLDITLSAEVSPSPGQLLAAIQRAVPQEWASLPTAEIQQALGQLGPMFNTSLNGSVTLRLFRPSFQQEKGFPESARGYRLQTLRSAAGTSYGFNVSRSIPVLPGVMARLGARFQRTQQIPQMERMFADTMTGTLLRYISLHTPSANEDSTWALMLQRHGRDVDRLAKALATPDAPAAVEVRHWLERDIGPEGATDAQKDALAVLDSLGQMQDAEERRNRMHALFIALSEPIGQAKRASSLIGPAQLPRR